MAPEEAVGHRKNAQEIAAELSLAPVGMWSILCMAAPVAPEEERAEARVATPHQEIKKLIAKKYRP